MTDTVPGWLTRDYGVPPDSRQIKGHFGGAWLWPDGRHVTDIDPMGRVRTVYWPEPAPDPAPQPLPAHGLGVSTSGMTDDQIRAAVRRRFEAFLGE